MAFDGTWNANWQASSDCRKALRLMPVRRHGNPRPPANGCVSVARSVRRANTYGEPGTSPLPACSAVTVSRIRSTAAAQSASNGDASPVAAQYPCDSRSTEHRLSSSYFRSWTPGRMSVRSVAHSPVRAGSG